jgi:hypothetical protein
MFIQTVFLLNYYVTKPQIGLDETYSECRCQELKLVPVLRIFGSTPEGNSFPIPSYNSVDSYKLKLH